MVPLLTGFDDEDIKSLGHSGFRGTGPKKLDGWPWLFYEMHDHGYITGWQMDSCMECVSPGFCGVFPSQHFGVLTRDFSAFGR
jgi:hypothetical protein